MLPLHICKYLECLKWYFDAKQTLLPDNHLNKHYFIGAFCLLFICSTHPCLQNICSFLKHCTGIKLREQMFCRFKQFTDILQIFCRHSPDILQMICRESADHLQICCIFASRSVADWKQICQFPMGLIPIRDSDYFFVPHSRLFSCEITEVNHFVCLAAILKHAEHEIWGEYKTVLGEYGRGRICSTLTPCYSTGQM